MHGKYLVILIIATIFYLWIKTNLKYFLDGATISPRFFLHYFKNLCCLFPGNIQDNSLNIKYLYLETF